MNFDWTPEQQKLKKQIAAIFDSSEKQNLFAAKQSDSDNLRKLVRDYQSKIAQTGYMKLAQGPNNGSQVLSLIAMQEELAKASNWLFISIETSARLFGGLLAGYGKSEFSDKILKSLQAGEQICAVAVSEPENADTSDFFTKAVEDDGIFILNGKKNYVTNAPIADHIAFLAKVGDQWSFFVVESSQEGLTIEPRLETLGYEGLCVAGLELENVRVSKDAQIGPFNDEAPIEYLKMMEGMMLSSASVGLTHQLFSTARDHAKNHYRGGKPIIHYQEVGFSLAEMLTLLQTSEFYVRRAGWAISNNDLESETLVHCAKVFCTDVAEQIAGKAMQVMAGAAFIKGNPVESGYRDAKFAPLAGTTNEVARMKIADYLLTKYQV